MEGRILAVDPGSKRIGIALSDPSRKLATPLTVILHKSLETDCVRIAQLCTQHDVSLVVVGQPLGTDNEINRQSRHSQKVAEELRTIISVPVELWDESFSTNTAQMIKLESGVNRKKRAGHQDHVAAAVILQSYLDAHEERGENA